RLALLALEEVGIADLADRFPDEMSGGQQQRVAIPRAIVGERRLILADEPTGNLGRDNAEQVFELLRRLHLLEGRTSIIVTHNEELARRCDRVLRLSPAGRQLDVREI
ncbi:ATP-binding cassette domain-containing protein, partial [Citrobacter sp. AAK_AS5]